jgi:hypothetical protein
MLDGIYSFEITFLGTIIKGIAMAENNNIRGFNWSHVYKVERSEKHGKTYWHVTETPHASDTQGFVRRGFPAKLEGEEGEDRFAFEVAGEADDEGIEPRSSAMRPTVKPFPSRLRNRITDLLIPSAQKLFYSIPS